MVSEPPGASWPGSVQVNGPLGSDPVQPDGSAVISAPTGGVYTTVRAVALDGPTFVTVSVIEPDVPGTIEGTVTATFRSADEGNVVMVDGVVLFGVAGSAVGDVAEALPPVRVDDGGAVGSTLIGTVMVALPPTAKPAATVHVIGPTPGTVPVQPDGRLEICAPVGAVYVNVVGPAESDGPLLVTVTTPLPVWPGTIDGVVIVVFRSAEAANVVTWDGAALLAAAGSAVGDDAVTVPPVSVVDGGADDATCSGTSSVFVAPGASGPATAQLMGPAGIGPVQPAGSDVMSTPTGGV
jgi:hypothetical protein